MQPLWSRRKGWSTKRPSSSSSIGAAHCPPAHFASRPPSDEIVEWYVFALSTCEAGAWPGLCAANSGFGHEPPSHTPCKKVAVHPRPLEKAVSFRTHLCAFCQAIIRNDPVRLGRNLPLHAARLTTVFDPNAWRYRLGVALHEQQQTDLASCAGRTNLAGSGVYARA